MSANRVREELEAWQTKNMLDHGISEGTARASLARQDDKYGPFVEFAWTVWQASRAALVVELPATIDVPKGVIASVIIQGFNTTVEGLREALEAAGVRVKE